jgi:riboflavin synthase
MFNGIIKKTGIIKQISKFNNNYYIEIITNLKFTKSEIGSSIACSGVCLTLNKIKKNICTFYLSLETINKSLFKYSKKGDKINLEKSLKFGDYISGHFVQGHVDTTATVSKIDIVGRSWFINFKIPKKFKKLLIEKASISINGVSLTISKVTKIGFQVVVIPQSLKLTNLLSLQVKSIVNIELDILSKYIKSYLNEKK